MAKILDLENAELLRGRFMNFSGEPGTYNRNGDKYFNVIIPEDLVEPLERDGWYIKPLNPRDPEEAPRHYLKVKVSYRNEKYLPDIYIITGRRKTLMDDNTVKTLDSAEILYVDLTIRGSNYQRDDGSWRLSAYVQTMYVTVAENRFASKYDFDDEDEIPFN